MDVNKLISLDEKGKEEKYIKYVIKNIKYIDWDKAFQNWKNQPLKPHVNIDRIEYDKAIKIKAEYDSYYEHVFEEENNKIVVLKRWAKSIVKWQEHLEPINNTGWSWRVDLFGEMWSVCTQLLKKYSELKSANSRKKQNYSPSDFFNEVMEGKLSRIEIDNSIQLLTDNFKLPKLELLLNDINELLFCNKIEKESEYTSEDITRATNELIKQGKEIPFVNPTSNDKKAINIEKLMFPHYYLQVYQCLNYIKQFILKANGKGNENSNNSIKGFDSSLDEKQIEKLYDSMKGNYFETTKDNLTAILKGYPLNDVKIKWIDKSKTRPQQANLRTIFEFIFLLVEFEHIKKSEIKSTFNNKLKLYQIIGKCFIDGIQDKPFKNIEKGNEQNTPTQKTDRHKQLKQIISSL